MSRPRIETTYRGRDRIGELPRDPSNWLDKDLISYVRSHFSPADTQNLSDIITIHRLTPRALWFLQADPDYALSHDHSVNTLLLNLAQSVQPAVSPTTPRIRHVRRLSEDLARPPPPPPPLPTLAPELEEEVVDDDDNDDAESIVSAWALDGDLEEPVDEHAPADAVELEPGPADGGALGLHVGQDASGQLVLIRIDNDDNTQMEDTTTAAAQETPAVHAEADPEGSTRADLPIEESTHAEDESSSSHSHVPGTTEVSPSEDLLKGVPSADVDTDNTADPASNADPDANTWDTDGNEDVLPAHKVDESETTEHNTPERDTPGRESDEDKTTHETTETHASEPPEDESKPQVKPQEDTPQATMSSREELTQPPNEHPGPQSTEKAQERKTVNPFASKSAQPADNESSAAGTSPEGGMNRVDDSAEGVQQQQETMKTIVQQEELVSTAAAPLSPHHEGTGQTAENATSSPLELVEPAQGPPGDVNLGSEEHKEQTETANDATSIANKTEGESSECTEATEPLARAPSSSHIEGTKADYAQTVHEDANGAQSTGEDVFKQGPTDARNGKSQTGEPSECTVATESFAPEPFPSCAEGAKVDNVQTVIEDASSALSTSQYVSGRGPADSRKGMSQTEVTSGSSTPAAVPEATPQVSNAEEHVQSEQTTQASDATKQTGTSAQSEVTADTAATEVQHLQSSSSPSAEITTSPQTRDVTPPQLQGVAPQQLQSAVPTSTDRPHANASFQQTDNTGLNNSTSASEGTVSSEPEKSEGVDGTVAGSEAKGADSQGNENMDFVVVDNPQSDLVDLNVSLPLNPSSNHQTQQFNNPPPHPSSSARTLAERESVPRPKVNTGPQLNINNAWGTTSTSHSRNSGPSQPSPVTPQHTAWGVANKAKTIVGMAASFMSGSRSTPTTRNPSKERQSPILQRSATPNPLSARSTATESVSGNEKSWSTVAASTTVKQDHNLDGRRSMSTPADELSQTVSPPDGQSVHVPERPEELTNPTPQTENDLVTHSQDGNEILALEDQTSEDTSKEGDQQWVEVQRQSVKTEGGERDGERTVHPEGVDGSAATGDENEEIEVGGDDEEDEILGTRMAVLKTQGQSSSAAVDGVQSDAEKDAASPGRSQNPRLQQLTVDTDGEASSPTTPTDGHGSDESESEEAPQKDDSSDKKKKKKKKKKKSKSKK